VNSLNLGNDDIAMPGFFRFINDHQVTGVKTDIRHGVSDGPDKIGRMAPECSIR
jgi:hypothetical protein